MIITCNKAFTIKLLVNEVLLEMELDTGAGVSVLPGSVYKDRFWKCELKPTLVRLKRYDGAIIKPIGEVELIVNP